jgi:hypothetical protein
MNRRPLHFISREKEWELIQKLFTIINTTDFDPRDTAVLMVSPDYSASVAMILAHGWSSKGEIIPIIPVEVPYPDEGNEEYVRRMVMQQMEIRKYNKARARRSRDYPWWKLGLDSGVLAVVGI